MERNAATPRKRILFILFIALCAAVLALSVYMLLSESLEYAEGEQVYEDLTKDFVAPPKATEENNTPDTESEYTWPTVDFDALSAVNPDIVAWIFCEDTTINYPVVQGTDNYYYLKRLFDRSYNSAGCLFVDSRNAPGFTDSNTVIYGHHMKNKSMFGALTAYKDQAYYDAHPRLLLLTPSGNYFVELFSGYVAKVSDKSWQLSFANVETFESWLQNTRDRSAFQSETTVSVEDRILTLSTCSYEFNNARFVLIGKLIPG